MHSTDRVDRANALSDSIECEYCILAGDLPIPILGYDAQYQRRYENPAAVELLRRKSGHASTLPSDAEMLSSENLELYKSAIREVAETGAPRDLELECDSPTLFGSEAFFVRLVVPTASDINLSVLAVCFDITARKQAEAKLQEREDFLNTLIDTIPVPVFSKSREGRYFRVNKEYETFFGAPREHFFGKTVFDTHPSELAQIYHDTDEALFNDGGVQKYELRTRNELQQEREVSVTKAVFQDREGRAAGLIGAIVDLTEQNRAQEELKHALEVMEGVIAAIPDVLFEVDRDGRYLNIWTNHDNLLAAPRETLLGRTVSEVLEPQQAAAAMLSIEEADKTGKADGHFITLDLPNGDRRWFELSAAKLGGEAPISATFVVLSRDVTARKEAEQALNMAHARLLSMLQAIPDMVWHKSADGVYLSCNSAFERFVGKQEREILGKTDHDLFNPELAAFFCEMDCEAIKARRVRVNEEWVVYPDTAERVLFETREVPVFDIDGNVTGVLGLARDITERKRLEERLADREREFRTLVEHSPDIIVRHGRDLRFLYVNPTCAEMFGAEPATMLGKLPSDYLRGQCARDYGRRLTEVFESGGESEFELKLELEEGKALSNLVRLTPEFSTDGTVASVLAVGRDITELCATREYIQQMAYYDPLTSLPNRASLNERLRRTFAAEAVNCAAGAVMVIDLDRFKGVNDTLGHAVGDELLCEAAERLSRCVRLCDTVARLGGDEFAVLLPDAGSHELLQDIARAIVAKLDEGFMLNGREVFISCSLGIARYPEDSVDADDLMKYADSAMYQAKRTGRRGFSFYSKDLTIDAAKRLALESDLRRAIELGELELHYQPKVSLKNHDVTGSEALIRWHRPDVGLVAPSEFIPIAEETGLIVKLGEWVLREACRTAAEWNAGGNGLHRVAVNLSPKQFQYRGLARTVAQILRETGCEPQWLEIEITENLLLEENEATSETLSAFKSMGLSIAIDDFGTGYSAFGYLARFPIDTLKIDKSFVSKAMLGQRHAELVKAILSIANCMGQEVIAEGVETVEQAAFLAANGCQFAQGFLFSRPLPKREMAMLPRRLPLERGT